MDNDIYLFNYIKGNDLDNKEILQDDYKFMMKVIDITNDKKYYNLCSDKVKSNYNFVKFLIEKFSFDKSFIGVISYLYFQNNLIDEKYKELLIIVNDLLKDFDSFCSFHHKRILGAFYNSAKVNIENFKNSYPDCNDIVQKGFIIIHNNHKSSYVIIDYFAKRFIEEIFIINEKCILEDLIHNNFNSFNKLKEYGINKFLINYIEKYDMCLADYIRCNVSLLDDIKLNLIYIEENFDNYIKKEKSNLVNFERANKKFIK